MISGASENEVLEQMQDELYGEATDAHTSLTPLNKKAQTSDLFSLAMRNFLVSDNKMLPKDEVLRVDVIRLSNQFVLDAGNWLCYLDPEIKPRLSRPVLYVPSGVRGEVLNRMH